MFTDTNGFLGRRNWYRGNLHCHSTGSDGRLSPRQLVELYRENGYHFLAITEHDLYTDYSPFLNSSNFVILPGLEASAELLDSTRPGCRKKVHHIQGILGSSHLARYRTSPALAHRENFPRSSYSDVWDGVKTADDLALSLQRRGLFTIYNHPVWSRVDISEIREQVGIRGIEIYNYNTVNESGTGYQTLFWDALLRDEKNIYGFATDDNHNEGTFEDSLGGAIIVNADSLTQEDLMTNIEAGNFYATSGPAIHAFGIEHGEAYVRSSGVARINLIAGGYVNAGATRIAASPDIPITEARFRLSGLESYIRAECVDRDGKTAWTNAIFPSLSE